MRRVLIDVIVLCLDLVGMFAAFGIVGIMGINWLFGPTLRNT